MGKGTNLHKVWDSEIIEDVNITLSDCLKLANTLSANEKKKIQTNNVEVWMTEARELLPEVYNFALAFPEQEFPVLLWHFRKCLKFPILL